MTFVCFIGGNKLHVALHLGFGGELEAGLGFALFGVGVVGGKFVGLGVALTYDGDLVGDAVAASYKRLDGLGIVIFGVRRDVLRGDLFPVVKIGGGDYGPPLFVVVFVAPAV